MEIFLICINAVVPIFLFMAVGYLCQRIGLIKREMVPAMNTVAFNVFLTCTVFNSVYKSDLSQTFNPGLIVFACVATVLSFLAATLFSRVAIKEDDQRGVTVQGIFRSNFIMVGMQLAIGLGGDPAVAAIAMIGIATIPLNNVLAVVTLSMHGAQKTSWKGTLVKICKNPLIISTLLALVIVTLGIKLPSPVATTISQMGSAATPLMLFLLGAYFQFNSLNVYKAQLVAITLGKLVIIPLVVLSIAVMMGFNGYGLIALTALFASSTANASFTMAEQMGGDAELASDVVAVTSAVCPFTLFAFSYALMSMGFF